MILYRHGKTVHNVVLKNKKLPHGVEHSVQYTNSTENISHNPWTDDEETSTSFIIENFDLKKNIQYVILIIEESENMKLD